MAERSKALVLGTSLFGGVGSNPTAATGFGAKTPIVIDNSQFWESISDFTISLKRNHH